MLQGMLGVGTCQLGAVGAVGAAGGVKRMCTAGFKDGASGGGEGAGLSRGKHRQERELVARREGGRQGQRGGVTSRTTAACLIRSSLPCLKVEGECALNAATVPLQCSALVAHSPYTLCRPTPCVCCSTPLHCACAVLCVVRPSEATYVPHILGHQGAVQPRRRPL